MGTILNEFRAAGITFVALPDGALKAVGHLTDETRAAIREHKATILAELSAANDPAAAAYPHWSIQFQELAAIEAIFHPEATHAEVAAIYPGASIESLPDPPRRTATPAEADELRALIALILHDAADANRAEALAVALTDPDAALASFRVLAAQLQPGPAAGPDDRRACERCANLDRQRGRDGFRRCAAARRGELADVATRDYSPVPDVPKRCEAYQPTPADPDGQSGMERWPDLTAGAERRRWEGLQQ